MLQFLAYALFGLVSILYLFGLVKTILEMGESERVLETSAVLRLKFTMNKKKDVFILGAGASKPYDFSTGPELIESIIENLLSSLYEWKDRM